MGREIGIDLGTTNTIVSYINKHNMPVTIELADTDESIIPSVIFYENKSDVKIGKRALNLERQFPEACIKNFKSFFEEPRHKFSIKAKDGTEFKLTPEQVAGRFLREVIRGVQDKIVEEYGDDDEMNYIDKVVISVPAKFDDLARGVVKKAALSANLTNVELTAEPTAAAIAYMQVRPEMKGKNVIVYDFGGGTFDLSLLSNEEGVFKVRYTDGDPELGGNTITNRIICDMIDRINDDFDIYMPYTPEKYRDDQCSIDRVSVLQNFIRIRTACNDRIKHEIARGKNEFEDEIELIVGKNDDGSYKKKFFHYFYTVDTINRLIENDIDKTISITKKAVEWADSNKVKIDKIILAGGSSQIPMIFEKLNSEIQSVLTGNVSAISDDDISLLISRGAALMANDEFRKNVVEITNYEIGVKQTRGALMDEFCVVIPDSKELPYTVEREFGIPDDSSDYILDIFQRDPKHWDHVDQTIRSEAVRFRDSFVLHDLPLEKKDRVVVFVFTLNEDGSMSVTANIKQNGTIISQNHTVERESNLL